MIHLLNDEESSTCISEYLVSNFGSVHSSQKDSAHQTELISEPYIGNNDLFRTLVQCNIPHTTINKILKILRNYTNPFDITKLPANFKTAVGKYPHFNIKNINDDADIEDQNTDDSVENKPAEIPNIKNELTKKDLHDSSQFIYFGIQCSMESGAAKFYEDANELVFSFNIDGLPPFKSSKECFGPILEHFEGYKVFTIALYYGNSKPKNSNCFLTDFVNEMIDICQNGVTVQNKTYIVRLKMAFFDSLARSFSLRIPNFNSYDGCYRCHVQGQYINNRMCFQSTDAPLQTVAEFEDFPADVACTALLRISNFDVHKHVVLDVMHVWDLRVTRKHINVISKGLSQQL